MDTDKSYLEEMGTEEKELNSGEINSDTSNSEGESFSSDMDQEVNEGDKILKYNLRDWFGIFIPFLRSKNHLLYKKVKNIRENLRMFIIFRDDKLLKIIQILRY